MTLDPLVRKVRLGPGREILLVDTVGFIQKLPHSLVAAFRATLEEVKEADLLLHVVDASSPGRRGARGRGRVRAARDRRRRPAAAARAQQGGPDPGGAARGRSRRRGRAAWSSPRSPAEGLDRLLAAVASRLDLEPRRVRLSFAAGDRRGVSGVYAAGRVLGHEVVDGRVLLEAEMSGRALAALPGAPAVRQRLGPPRPRCGVLAALLAGGCAKRVARPDPGGGGLRRSPRPRRRGVGRRGEGPPVPPGATCSRGTRRSAGAPLREAAEAAGRASRPRRPASPTRACARGRVEEAAAASPRFSSGSAGRHGGSRRRGVRGLSPGRRGRRGGLLPPRAGGAPRTTPSCAGGSRRSSCRPPSGGWGWPRPRSSAGTRRPRCASTRGPSRRRPRSPASAWRSPTCWRRRGDVAGRGRAARGRPVGRPPGRPAARRSPRWASRSSRGRAEVYRGLLARDPLGRGGARGGEGGARGAGAPLDARGVPPDRRGAPGHAGGPRRPRRRARARAAARRPGRAPGRGGHRRVLGAGARGAGPRARDHGRRTRTTPSSPARWCAGSTSRAPSRAPSTSWAGPGRPAPPPSDMSRSHLDYDAVERVLGAGLMGLAASGGFEPWRPVSGQEAIEVVDGVARLAGS